VYSFEKPTEVSEEKSRACHLLRAGFLHGLFFDPEDGGDVPPKVRMTFNGLHGNRIRVHELVTQCQ
jgi:hypothetical protein